MEEMVFKLYCIVALFEFVNNTIISETKLYPDNV